MTKWEYCQVIWTVKSANETDRRRLEMTGFGEELVETETKGRYLWRVGHVQYLRSKETESFTGYAEMFTQLGMDGWELVAATGMVQLHDTERYLFKRPLAEEE